VRENEIEIVREKEIDIERLNLGLIPMYCCVSICKLQYGLIGAKQRVLEKTVNSQY